MLPIVIYTTGISLRTIIALITGARIIDDHHEFDIFESPFHPLVI
jgi:hypothetical protein